MDYKRLSLRSIWQQDMTSKALFVLLCGVAAVAAFPPHFRRGAPPCGLPPYVDDLPEELQDQVRSIWKNYKEGDKCYEEQGLTREVLDNLTKEQRRVLFKGAFLPPFLKKASKEIQDQFKAIFKDRSIKFADKPAKFKELAEKVLDGDLLKEFNEFHNKMQENIKEFDEKVAKLSPEAKEAYEKLDKLDEQKRDIMAGVSEDARDELMEIHHEKWSLFAKAFGKGGHRGHKGGKRH